MGHNAAVKWLLIAFVMMTAALPANAWNGTGHRLIAYIAWHQMSPVARHRIGDLLAHHPEARRWVSAGKEQEPGLTCFLEASVWPDTLRSDPRFFDERSEAPTPLLPGFSDMAQHRHWHYIDLPLGGGPAEGDGELDQQLRRLIATLRPAASPSPKSAQTLAWVIHLLGDIHQPLHVGSQRDGGGNLHRIEDPANARLPISNLHRWWDDRPGPPWLKGWRLRRAAERLLERQPSPPSQGDVAVWRQETFRLTAAYGYPESPVVTPDFAAQAQRITEAQLVAAGFRLGRLLDGIYGEVPRETRRE